MNDSMMLDPLVTNQVSIEPHRDSTPTDIHLDDYPRNLARDISNTAASSALEMTESDSVPMQSRIGSAKTALETTSQIPIAATAEAETPPIVVQMNIATEKSVTNAEADSETMEEATPATFSQVEGLDSNYTTSALVEDATPGVGLTVHEVAHKDTPANVYNDTPHGEEVMNIETHRPGSLEREVPETIITKPTTEDTEAPELKHTMVTTSEQKDSGNVGISIGEQNNSCPESLKPSKLVAENIQNQDGLDLEKIASEVASPENDPCLPMESHSEAAKSDDAFAQVARIAATYDPTGGNQISPSEIAAVESAEQHNIDTSEIPAVRTSLFGGPVGPQILPQSDNLKTPEAGSVLQTDSAEGFDELFPKGVADAPALSDDILQEHVGTEMSSFKFGNSNIEEDVENEAEAGAEQEVPSQPPSSDHDAKPDINALYDPTSENYIHNPTSPTYSHTTSNNSYATQKSNESEVHSMLGLNSDDLFNTAADNKETPEALVRYGRGIVDQSRPEVIETHSPCNCENQHCEHRVMAAFNLRQGPRKEGYVNISNLICDNDNSGTYTDEQRYYPSAQKVTMEDLDNDEETNDGEEQDHVMSGGLPSDPADPNGRFNTIPFNHTDTLIRNKRPFDEESSSSDESRTKKNKKRKKTKSQSSKAAKKSQNNNGTTNIRSIDDSDEEAIQIDEQASAPAPKTSTKKASTKKAPAKKRPSTTEPGQTIVQMLQRLAKPHITRLSYPITFNRPATSCAICNDPDYAINGCSSIPRRIKIYDFGQGSQEIPDANKAGNAVAATMAPRPKNTQLCLSCTTRYMKILMCSTHDVTPISTSTSPHDNCSSPSSSSEPLQISPPQASCTICAATVTYTCELNCGAKFCDTCAPKVYGEYEGSLTATLDIMTDEVTAEYPRGLRADVELLRKNGELWKFLSRMARKKTT